jgi:SAM-dependent methyltransferase
MPKHFPARSLAPRPRAKEMKAAADTAWERPAAWYDQLIGQGGDDFYRELILPAVLARLAAKPGQRVLDVCCGQGVLGRVLALQGLKTLGIDASPSLIEAAKARAGALEQHRVGDARNLDAALGDEVADHAALIMCLQDLDPLAPVLNGVAKHVRPSGRIVLVMTHPCFRIPRRSSWGWDEDNGVQYRRLDGYVSPLTVPIKTHPGMPADPTRTLSFHRPLATYLNALGDAGLAVTACDELCSHRRGTKGTRYGAEDRSAKEFPVFLVLTAEHRR